MAIDSGTDAGLLALLNQSNKNSDGVGGMNGLLGIAALRMLMPGMGVDGAVRPLTPSDVQNIVNDSAAAQTANSNAMLLLKDIQDSSQLTDSLIASTAAAGQMATLNAEIANLQGQSDIRSAIGDATVNLTAQHALIHASVEASASANALATAESKYQTLQAITADGALTRSAIAHLAESIPNARELDLQRQLTVALDNERHRDVVGRINEGNVTVTTNVNQAQAQAQSQLQIQNLAHSVACLSAHQQTTANNLNILGTQRGINQTPVNVNQ